MAAKRKPAAQAEQPDAYLESLKKKFALSQDLCEPARKEWQTDQDYYDGIQWTADEIAKLNKRKQPALTFNHVKPAINGMIGLVEKGRTDPQAFGKTPQDNDAAEVATDSLRYVADLNRLNQLRSQALKDLFIPGVCCAVVEVDEKSDPKVTKGRPEAFFHDPYSREPDFSDARWKGLANWMDEDDALALPYVDDAKKQAAIKTSVDSNGLAYNQTTQDRPQGGWSWADSKTRRLMVVQMWHRLRGVWRMSVFVSGGILQDGECEYRDQDGRPFCNLIAQSAYVDRENRRYGAVRDMRGPQDAINKGRSKAVHLLNVAKLRVDPSVGDVDAIRAEWAKPDGVIEARDGQVQELGDKQLMPSHIELLRDAKAEMQRQSPTPGIVGRQSAQQSGRAILAEQQAGMTEQAPLLAQFDDWTLRIYRASWACIKQFWTAPKYIRVTDDVNAPKYVLLNQPFPVTDKQGNPVIDPKTGQPKMKLIKPAEIDADIIIDSTPDVASLQEEQFQKLVELNTAAAQEQLPDRIPFEAIIEASSLPRKRQILERMKQAKEERAQQPQPPDPVEIEQQKQQVQLAANAQKNQQDLQAHQQKMDREAAVDNQKTANAMKIEQQRHNNAQQAANNQAHRDRMKMRQQMQERAQPAGDGGEGQAAQGELPLGDGQPEDDMNFNIQLPPEVTQALVDHVVKTRDAVATTQAQAAQASAQAQAAIPQAMLAVAQSMKEAADAMKQAAMISAAPKQLQVVNGVKVAVPVLGTMN